MGQTMAELFTTPARATDANGENLSGAKWFFYQTGTLTPQSVFTTAALSTAHLNPVVADAAGKFPAIYFDTTKQYRGILRTADEATVIYDLDPINTDAMSLLAAPTGSARIGFLQAGVNSVATTLDAKAKEMPSAKDKGAAPAASNAANKTAVQKLITDVSTAGTGQALINPDIDYGYVNTNPATYPSFASATGDFVLYDYAIGDADGAGNKAGSQVRVWMHTQQTTPAGMHDGNTWWQRAAWHPAHIISNDMDLSGTRLATDNRRASFYTAINGETAWRIGQGSLASATATDEELANFTIEMFARTSGDTKSTYIPLVIERKTGNWSIGSGTNSPTVSYDFASLTTGFDQVRFTNPFSTRSRLIMRNSAGAGDDVYLDSNAGDLVLSTTFGSALTASKTTGRVKISLGLCQNRRSYADTATVTIDAALGNLHNIGVTTATAFTIAAPANPADGQRITIKIANSSGGAMGVITWNAVFKMAAWTNPAAGFERAIDFWYDGLNWRQCGATVDVPN